VPDVLVEFIEARLAEDEAAAGACEDPQASRVWYDSREPGSAGHVIQTQGGYVVARIGRDDVNPDAVAAFIAAHDPYRAQRRVRMLREVLRRFREAQENQEKLGASPGGVKSVRYAWEESSATALRLVLRAAAAEWSEHPGYGAAIESW
jgi:Family of unknown function (DUF6221)